MKLRSWLERQVTLLEEGIRNSPVFDSAGDPAPEELHELKVKAVLHGFLHAQLEELEARRIGTRREEEAMDSLREVAA
ncbi:MAG: hypothetical protein WBX15_10270 [Thermoanaerobaculia bacterium]